METNLTISGYSTALFSTFYLVDEYGIMFDCGDGVSAMLTSKSRKAHHVFISHADRDHLTGLPQFLQLNTKDGFPKVYFPRDTGSFPALKDFLSKFDAFAGKPTWIPVEEDEAIDVGKGLRVIPKRNEHIRADGGKMKSLSYCLQRVKRKLNDDLLGKDSDEIAMLRQEKGEAGITHEAHENLIWYSGDTPVRHDKLYDNTRVLIHEATFLDNEMLASNDQRWNRHSSLPEVMEMVADLNIEKLVLGHFSVRYHADEIDRAIEKEAKRVGLKIPVYRVLPGEFMKDIFENGRVF